MKTPPHSPEPWSLDLPGNPNTGINDRDGNPILTETGNAPFAAEGMKKLADAERVIRCVNALAGIEDPEAAITEAREALNTAIPTLDQDRDLSDSEIFGCGQYHQDRRKALRACQSALAKLTPKPDPWDGINADEFVRSVRDGSYQPEEEA